MDKSVFETMLQMLSSENDSDAVMGLRGLHGLLKSEGVDLATMLTFAAAHLGDIKKASMTVDQLMTSPVVTERAPVTISGMPQCQSPKAGCIEMIAPGANQGEVVVLPGASAEYSTDIALNMKDALVAAAINKSRFKLKLLDVKNAKGEVVETVLQAEYERDGMMAIRVWVNVRGEVAALATVLRKAVSNNFPDLVAA